MQYIYDNLFQAVLGAASSDGRRHAINVRPADVAQNGSTFTLSTVDFTLIVQQSPDTGRWGYDWVWTDTAGS